MRKHFSETTAHQRLTYAFAAGVATAALPLPVTAQLRGLLAWGVGGSVYLGLSWWLAVEFDAVRTRHRAQAQDQPAFILSLLLVLSAFANVVAIAVMLQHTKDFSSMQRFGYLALSMTAVAISWLLMQTVIAFRYAHVYYQEELRSGVHGGGLEFPGKLAPDYFDFLYYAHVVGMTAQVSDVVVTTRRMRRLTLIHSVTAFAFNMLVLALSINVVSGAMQ